MPIYEWTSLKKKQQVKHLSPGFEVSNHPLKTCIVVSNNVFIDNLNKWCAAFEEVDPLSTFNRLNLEEKFDTMEAIDVKENYSKVWDKKRSFILSKYTTGEKLTIISSFLPGGEKSLFRQVSVFNEKVKHRLEQLDEFDENSVSKTMGLSQQEFVTKINMLSDEMKKAWDTEQRVNAFKIAIQCSKLLSDVSVMQFYPSKFVLITDLLDTFGNLVFQRLIAKCNRQKEIHDFQDFEGFVVSESARETCQNWIYKMASIRELLPRLYMEMTLLKCYLFISKDEIAPTIERLTLMIRGIGNPLVAIYLRLYLCYVASKLMGKYSEKYFRNNFKEFIDEYHQIFNGTMKKKYESQHLPLEKYLNVYMPAIQDLLSYSILSSDGSNLPVLEDLLRQCSDTENSQLLLCGLVTAFDSASVSANALQIMEMLQKPSSNVVLLSEVLVALGEHLCHSSHNCGPLTSETLIKNWWKIASNEKSLENFLLVLAPWIEYACTYLSTQHINIILRGTIRYIIKCGQSIDDYTGQFELVINRILKSISDVEELFLMDAFMPLVELVQTSSAQTNLAKRVLSVFFTKCNSCVIDDHIIITSLMRLCCKLHDSISAMTVNDECKICAELINKFIQLVVFSEDLEEQLNFYVECRSAFLKLDAVLITLVHAVNGLAVRSEPRQYRWLQRACAAYCYVTVPSLRCPLIKAQMYLLSAQVTLLNNCQGQCEANFKAFIGLIPDIPDYKLEDGQKKPTHTILSGILSDFLSTILLLPDNVDGHCKAYVLSGFIKVLDRVPWGKTDQIYFTTLLRTLELLCEMTQEKYAYSIEGVLSNDKLYGNETEFVMTIDKHATNICQKLLGVLKALGDVKDVKIQYNLALQVFWCVVIRADLQQESMSSLAANLWLLSQNINKENRMANSLISMLNKRCDPGVSSLLLKIRGSADV